MRIVPTRAAIGLTTQSVHDTRAVVVDGTTRFLFDQIVQDMFQLSTRHGLGWQGVAFAQFFLDASFTQPFVLGFFSRIFGWQVHAEFATRTTIGSFVSTPMTNLFQFVAHMTNRHRVKGHNHCRSLFIIIITTTRAFCATRRRRRR